ncbi:MAG: VOC family protein [Spirochaetia bacterium]|jgi:catechol 2,3-dioxygenase
MGLHPTTLMGAVSLTVARLDRQVTFFQEILGFRLHWREDGRAGLGAGGADLIQLIELPGSRRAPRTTGLYHFAVLFPDRRELARAVARLFEREYQNYPTDHVITKTTYLKDPEGQEIELYAESPEDGTMGIAEGLPFARRADGRPSDGRDPLDLDALFRELKPGDALDQPIPPATRIGHVHLYVRNVPEAVKFYTEAVGFDDRGFAPSFMMGMVSVAGYHHHIGLNSWMGEGAPPPPPGSRGLRHFSIVLPGRSELDRTVARVNAAGVSTETVESGVVLRDPSQNGILLTVP